MSQICIHQNGDRVYIRDVQCEWLPGIVEEVKEHEVLVRITLPKDWMKTTIYLDTTINNSNVDDIDTNQKDNDNNNMNHRHKVVVDDDGEKRWVKLVDYFNHHLPFQNWDDNSKSNNENVEPHETQQPDCNNDDMSQLQYIHEAELLYQIKKRYCSIHQQPYTRITTATTATSKSSITSTTNTTMMIMVAVNPCRYIPSLYTTEKQQFYIQYYMNKQQQSSSRFVSSEGK
jgi:hypothetical protein